MTSHGETTMSTWDDKDQHVKLLEKLQTKHDELFEKIVFAQREDKQDYAQAYAAELIKIRTHISRCRHMNMKMKWGEMYSDESYF
jgi:hypothetical protein